MATREQKIADLARQQSMPLSPGAEAGAGASRAAMEEIHVCLGCDRFLTCALSRLIAEFAGSGVFTALQGCTAFVPSALPSAPGRDEPDAG